MRRFFRSIHRQRAPVAAVPLVGVVLLAERPSTLIVELCLRAAAVLDDGRWAGRRGAALAFWRSLTLDELPQRTPRTAGLRAGIAADIFTPGSVHQCRVCGATQPLSAERVALIPER